MNCPVFALALGIILGVTNPKTQAQTVEKASPALNALLSTDPEKRIAVASAESQHRENRIQGLLRIAKEKERKPVLRGSRELAIKLLGEYRAAEAIDFLVENVSLALPAIVGSGAIEGYQCAEALVKIGAPSIDGIFRSLGRPCKEPDIRLFAHIIHRIDSTELGMYRLQLAAKEAEKNETMGGSEMRKNLRKLIHEYKNITGR